MAGFTDILGALIQSGMSQSSTKRMTNAFGSGGGSLNDIVVGVSAKWLVMEERHNWAV